MEDKEMTSQEIDTEIQKLLELKKKRETKINDYNYKPLRSKLAYDLQPIKILTGGLKTLIVILLIGGALVMYGYWKGKHGKPIMVDMKDFQAKVSCTYDKGKEHTIAVKNYQMYFDENPITEGDIPKLKPYGISLKPALFAGLGTKGPAIGAGFELAHFYKLNLDAFLMSDKAIYAGLSYDLSIDSKTTINWFQNSSVGLALGKGFDNPNDTRVMIYFKVKF